MMKVKIVRIIGRLNIGGPARNTMILSEGFPETVLVCGEVGETEGDMMYAAKEKGIEPIVIRELGREISWKDDFVALWKIYKILCREKPDIVHTHTAKAGAVGRMAGIIYRLKRFSTRPNILRACREDIRPRSNSIVIVHTFHGHVFSGYFGKIKSLIFIWIERILAIFTDRIITVSESLKKELVEKFKIAPAKKISVIELGFELEELLKMPERENDGCVNVGIVGRLVPIKNHRMVLDCARRVGIELRSNNIEKRVKFIIIGDGELREELKRCTRELGIEYIVEFKGWMKDVCEIYRRLDIVVLTSLNEGTPVSLIEAMAAGKPVVATNIGGVKDIVEDGKNGYLVESYDIEKFTERLAELVQDSKKRKIFGSCGRQIVAQRFSKDRLINDMEKLYNTLLSKK